MDSGVVKKGGAFGMFFKATDNGIVTVYPDPAKKDEKYEGTFEIENVSSKMSIYTLNYNKKTHIYKVSPWEKDLRALGPVPVFWVEDLTKEFKEKYPDKTFEKIEYKMYIYAQWY